MKTQKSAKPPVHTIRYGAIKASIWLNQTRNGAMHNITVSRTYKDGEQWMDSSSFAYDDLLLVAKALNECHSWIHEQFTSDSMEGKQKER